MFLDIQFICVPVSSFTIRVESVSDMITLTCVALFVSVTKESQ